MAWHGMGFLLVASLGEAGGQPRAGEVATATATATAWRGLAGWVR